MKQLFVYGSLLDKHFAEDILGHRIQTYSETLLGYKKVGLNIIEDEDSKVEGVAFEVSPKDLIILDRYEGVAHGLYKRIKITTESGVECIAYQKCDASTQVIIGNKIG